MPKISYVDLVNFYLNKAINDFKNANPDYKIRLKEYKISKSKFFNNLNNFKSTIKSMLTEINEMDIDLNSYPTQIHNLIEIFELLLKEFDRYSKNEFYEDPVRVINEMIPINKSYIKDISPHLFFQMFCLSMNLMFMPIYAGLKVFESRKLKYPLFFFDLNSILLYLDGLKTPEKQIEYLNYCLIEHDNLQRQAVDLFIEIFNDSIKSYPIEEMLMSSATKFQSEYLRDDINIVPIEIVDIKSELVRRLEIMRSNLKSTENRRRFKPTDRFTLEFAKALFEFFENEKINNFTYEEFIDSLFNNGPPIIFNCNPSVLISMMDLLHTEQYITFEVDKSKAPTFAQTLESGLQILSNKGQLKNVSKIKHRLNQSEYKNPLIKRFKKFLSELKH